MAPIFFQLRSIMHKRISDLVNNTHISRSSSKIQSPPFSAYSWLFAFILCCLPGAALTDTLPATHDRQDLLPPGHVQPVNTHAIVHINDVALVSQRKLAHVKRPGASSASTDRETPNPCEPECQLPALQTGSHARMPVAGQGFDTHSLSLVVRQATSPYSPRSPPVLV